MRKFLLASALLCAVGPLVTSIEAVDPFDTKLLTQPAVMTVPLAFATMALVSLTDRAPRRAPNAELLALHAPEGLGLGLEDEDVDAVRA